MTVEDVDMPTPAADKAVVRLDVAGVNFIDVNQRAGAYPVALPFTPGTEGAGVVTEAGSETTGLARGDRVAFAGVPGAYAQYISVPADRLVAIPDEVSTEQAGAVLLQGMTAHYLVESICTFDDDDWCLVHAAAGGVGLLLTQLAKRRGLRVMGTVSTPAKAERARAAGADQVVIYTSEDFPAAVAEVTEGKGVRAVYDSVGKTTFDASLSCLSRRGYMVFFGQSSGPVDPFDPRRLQQGGSLFLTRPGLVDYTSTRQQLLRHGEAVLSLVATGELDVHVHARFPLENAAEAHRALQNRSTVGKLVLVTG